MSDSITCVIVDDEPLSIEEFCELLAEFPRFQVIGRAEGVEDAIRVIRETDPQVLFLDVQMPPGTGFDVLARVEPTFKTVFVTAYDEFALRAFEVNALDYLLKPVRRDRLKKTLERLSGDEPTEPAKPLDYDDRLFITAGRQQIFMRLNTIKFIQASGNYSSITTTSHENLLVLKSIREWEERLPTQYFVRVHRSTIVNSDFVDRIEKWFNSSYVVFIKGHPTPLPMSRRRASQLRSA